MISSGKFKRTVLIASAAYIEPELEIEFGRIPPSFLPLGNKRLFVRQYESIREIADRIILSLPEDYLPDETDAQMLHDFGVEIVFVPIGLSLGHSVITVMNIAAVSAGGSFCILHGDTLLLGVDFTISDAVSIETSPPPSYHWGFASLTEGKAAPVNNPPDPASTIKQPVLSGWFSFSSPVRLIQGIARQDGNFLNGIADYASALPLQPLTTGEWFDFGHAGTFYSSRKRISTARDFNHLSFEARELIKSGSKPAKIEAEARWFENLPLKMRLYTPAYLGRDMDGRVSYSIEYLNQPTLSDLFVFGRLSRQAWERIFLACDEFLTACLAWSPSEPEIVAASTRSLYLDKTIARLEDFARLHGVDLGAPSRLNGSWLPSLERIAYMAAEAIPEPSSAHLSLVHGDFCFSNILYDQRSERVRVIDPRGHDANGEMTLYGDIRYDVGKLHHSAVGRYDFIIAGYYHLERRGGLDFSFSVPDGHILQGIAESFLDHNFAGLSTRQTAPAISVLLFLSMLPLHADSSDRQTALLANAMRLFMDLDR